MFEIETSCFYIDGPLRGMTPDRTALEYLGNEVASDDQK
jgi:hypothetical protein